MKSLLSFLVVILGILGFSKLADKIDSRIKSKAEEAKVYSDTNGRQCGASRSGV